MNIPKGATPIKPEVVIQTAQIMGPSSACWAALQDAQARINAGEEVRFWVKGLAIFVEGRVPTKEQA